MAVYLSTAFSLNMFPRDAELTIDVQTVTTGEVKDAIAGGFVNAVGHADTALAVSAMLERNIPANRGNVSMTEDDVMYVAQYFGDRLPEGATTLPEGAELVWKKVQGKIKK